MCLKHNVKGASGGILDAVLSPVKLVIDKIRDRVAIFQGYSNHDNKVFLRWRNAKIWRGATTVRNFYYGFKYVVPVSIKVMIPDGPHSYVNEDLAMFLKEHNGVIGWHRGHNEDGEFKLDDMFGEDKLFVAIDDELAATEVVLRWG